MNFIKKWYVKNFSEEDAKNHAEFVRHIEQDKKSKYDAYVSGKAVGVIYGVLGTGIFFEIIFILFR
jgi:hypothetical protein